MKYTLIILIFIVSGFMQSCNHNHSIASKNFKIDSLSQTKSDSVYKHDILEANKKFKITDSIALRLVRKIKDLRETIDWKCKNDSTILNDVVIDGVPNDTNPDWTITINQYQPRIQMSHRILTLLINANNGKIRIWDVPNDTILTFDSWRKNQKEIIK